AAERGRPRDERAERHDRACRCGDLRRGDGPDRRGADRQRVGERRCRGQGLGRRPGFGAGPDRPGL
ncbi:MAG: hypothetical protein AVDCRST_MAG52-2937, partial [uncultured Blastococcus sp.]